MPRVEQLVIGLIVTIVGGVALFFVLKIFDNDLVAPNLTNRTLDSANTVLAEAGIEYSVSTIPGINKEIVVSQHPQPGVAMDRNQAMLLVIESGVGVEFLERSRDAGTLVEKRVLVPAGTSLRLAIEGSRVISSDNYQASIAATLRNTVVADGELVFAQGANVLVDVSAASTFYKRTARVRAFGVGSPSGQTHPVHTTDAEFSSTASLGTIVTGAVLGVFIGAILGLILDVMMFFISQGVFAIGCGVLGLIIGLALGSNNFSEQKNLQLTNGQLVEVNLISDHNFLLLALSPD